MTRRGQLAGRARSTLEAAVMWAYREHRLVLTVGLAAIVWLLAVLLVIGPGW